MSYALPYMITLGIISLLCAVTFFACLRMNRRSPDYALYQAHDDEEFMAEFCRRRDGGVL